MCGFAGAMQGSTPPIMGYPEDDDQYKVPLIAKLLHALPHYNITFHRINNTFRPSNEVYLEVCFQHLYSIQSSAPYIVLLICEKRIDIAGEMSMI